MATKVAAVALAAMLAGLAWVFPAVGEWDRSKPAMSGFSTSNEAAKVNKPMPGPLRRLLAESAGRAAGRVP